MQNVPFTMRLLLTVIILVLALPGTGLARLSKQQREVRKQARIFNHQLDKAARPLPKAPGWSIHKSAPQRVKELLYSVRRGQMPWVNQEHIEQEVRKAGLSVRGFRAALEDARRCGAAKQAQVVGSLEAFPARRWSADDPLSRRIGPLVMGHHFWKARGRADLADRAAREARREAKQAGISLKLLDRALKQPSLYKIDAGFFVPVAESSVVEMKRKGISDLKTWAGVMYKWNDYTSRKTDPAVLPEGASRRINGAFRWWTGNQTAYLDLMYRKLPQLIAARFEQDPKDATFRIWHAGYENGSQSFFLAAAVDAAVARLKRRARPELRRYLDRLKVEIVATDLVYKLQHGGARRRELRFDPPGHGFASHEMYTLVTEELGPIQQRAAHREVSQLERAFGRARSEPERQRILDKLADAGGVGVAMERLLKVSPRVDHSSSHPRLVYQLHAKHWRVDDGPNKRVLNAGATGRTLRFRQGDLIKGAPRGTWDLVVCSNVLPYLADYQRIVQREQNGTSRGSGDWAAAKAAAEAEAARDAKAATRHLTRNLRPGGKLLLDIYSEETLQGLYAGQPSLQNKAWVTRARSIEALDLSTAASDAARTR